MCDLKEGTHNVLLIHSDTRDTKESIRRFYKFLTGTEPSSIYYNKDEFRNENFSFMTDFMTPNSPKIIRDIPTGVAEILFLLLLDTIYMHFVFRDQF